MFPQVALPEIVNIVPACVPGFDINADLSGDWVSLKDYSRCFVVIHKAAGTATDDPSIVINQATSAAGAGSKAVTFDHIYHKIGATALSSGPGVWTRIQLTTPSSDLDLVSVNGTDLLTDVGECLIGVDIKAEDLDVDNGFCYIQLFVEGDDIGNSTLADAFYMLHGSAQNNPQISPIA